MLVGDLDVGIARVGAVAHAAVRQGWESTGVTAFREASTAAAAALDYPAAVRWIDEGVRYADSIEQSHCAHVMRATLAMVSWAAADPSDAQRRARRAIVDKGCRRGAVTAHWALGYVAMSRGELDDATAELSAAIEFGIASEEIELIMPPLWGLAEVALQAGDPERALGLCRDALARSVAVGERVLLTPFVVTGVRAAHAGRPAGRGRRLARRLRDAGSIAIPDVAGAALDHGAGHRGPHGGSDRHRAHRPRIGGRWLGSPRTGVGGHLGPTRPGPRPDPHEPVRRRARGGERGPVGGGAARIAGR